MNKHTGTILSHSAKSDYFYYLKITNELEKK